MDMDMDPYCSAVNKPWGLVLHQGIPEECGPERKLFVVDDRVARSKPAGTWKLKKCAVCGRAATHYTVDGGDSKLICSEYPKCKKSESCPYCDGKNPLCSNCTNVVPFVPAEREDGFYWVQVLGRDEDEISSPLVAEWRTGRVRSTVTGVSLPWERGWRLGSQELGAVKVLSGRIPPPRSNHE
jgi:hypothetical protein